MKLELEDIVKVQSEMLDALVDYVGVLKMPNCNSCARGLDYCPAEGEPLRINCPGYFAKENGERPIRREEAPIDVLGAVGGFTETSDDEVVEAGVCEPADGPKCPDDPRLRNYLKHIGTQA